METPEGGIRVSKPSPDVRLMTSEEAWIAGHRAGREELAQEYQRDAQAAAVAESPAGVRERDERIASIEQRLTRVENEQRDNAGLVVRIGEVVTQLVGGKVE
jgi:hypothetical protein